MALAKDIIDKFRELIEGYYCYHYPKFMDGMNRVYYARYKDISDSERCPICKLRVKQVYHHIYYMDDGATNQFRAGQNYGKSRRKMKYPHWTIKICQKCNINLGRFNNYLKVVIFRKLKPHSFEQLYVMGIKKEFALVFAMRIGKLKKLLCNSKQQGFVNKCLEFCNEGLQTKLGLFA